LFHGSGAAQDVDETFKASLTDKSDVSPDLRIKCREEKNMSLRVQSQLFATVVLLGLFGCSKPASAPESQTPSDNTSSTAPAVPETPAPAAPQVPGPSAQRKVPSTKPVKKAAEQAPAPKPTVVDAGTVITVTIDETISSKTNNVGDHFDASVATPVIVDDKQVIPVGAKASGTVTQAQSAGKVQGNAVLGVTLESITVKGRTYRIQSAVVEEAGKGRGKRTAVGAGGGAVAGAIIGAIAGGGKGAAIGAAAGAGAGTAGAAFTGERDVTLAAETKLSFKLTAPLEIRTR
jgi:hypothetical protein